jgi:hypothetical protein
VNYDQFIYSFPIFISVLNKKADWSEEAIEQL